MAVSSARRAVNVNNTSGKRSFNGIVSFAMRADLLHRTHAVPTACSHRVRLHPSRLFRTNCQSFERVVGASSKIALRPCQFHLHLKKKVASSKPVQEWYPIFWNRVFKLGSLRSVDPLTTSHHGQGNRDVVWSSQRRSDRRFTIRSCARVRGETGARAHVPSMGLHVSPSLRCCLVMTLPQSSTWNYNDSWRIRSQRQHRHGIRFVTRTPWNFWLVAACVRCPCGASVSAPAAKRLCHLRVHPSPSERVCARLSSEHNLASVLLQLQW